jgi:hypothetical protein
MVWNEYRKANSAGNIECIELTGDKCLCASQCVFSCDLPSAKQKHVQSKGVVTVTVMVTVTGIYVGFEGRMSQAGMIGFLTLQQSVPSQMTWYVSSFVPGTLMTFEIYIYTYIYIIHVYLYVYIHPYMQTYIHTCTHKHIRWWKQWSHHVRTKDGQTLYIPFTTLWLCCQNKYSVTVTVTVAHGYQVTWSWKHKYLANRVGIIKLVVLQASDTRALMPEPPGGSALGCWVKEGWDRLFIFLCDMLLK